MFDQISSMANKAASRVDSDDAEDSDGDDRCHLNWLCNANINTAKHQTRAHTHSWCSYSSSWCLWCCCHKHIKVYGYWNRSRGNSNNNNNNGGNDLDQSHLMQICDLTEITGVRREIFRTKEHERKTFRRCFNIFRWQLFLLCLFLLSFLSRRLLQPPCVLRITIGTPNRCWPPWMLMTLNGLGKHWLRLPRRNVPRP